MFSLANSNLMWLSIIMGNFIWTNVCIIAILFFVALVYKGFTGSLFKTSLHKIGIYVAGFGMIIDILYSLNVNEQFLRVGFAEDFLICLAYFIYFKKNGIPLKRNLYRVK